MNEEKKSLEDALEKVDQDTQFGLRRPNADYRTSIYEKAPQIKNTWGSDEIPKNPHTHKVHRGAKIFFLISCAVCALVLVVVLASSFGLFGTTQKESIEITIDAPPFVDGGTPANIEVHVTNKGVTPLELTDLVLTYPEPKKTNVAGSDSVSYASSRVSLGDVAIGQTVSSTFIVTLFGSEGDLIPLTATFEYHVPNSNAIFTKEAKVTVQIRSTPLIITVGAPDTVVAGQTIPYVVTVVNKSPNILEDLIVEASYPPGFAYTKSDPVPFQGTKLWNIETLAPGESKVITISGVITAQTLESKTIRASVGTHDLQNNQIAILLNTGIKTITITDSFITTALTLSGKSGANIPVQENQRISGEVTVINSLAYPITNVVATLTFSGGLYNAGGVEPKNGFFDSNTQTITWQNGELSSIDAGDTVTLNFDITPKLQVGSTDKILKATLSLSAVVPGGIQPKLNDLQTITGVLATSLTFQAKTQYAGTTQGSTGPVPPKVGQKTTYNVVLDVSNNVNQVTNAVLTTKLPSYVTWEGSSTAGLSYNSVTREVIWTVPVVPAGSGYAQNVVKGVFKVSIMPSSSQFDDQPYLTDPLEIVGTDAVTKVEVRHRRNQGLNTTLTSDPVYGSGKGTVVQ